MRTYARGLTALALVAGTLPLTLSGATAAGGPVTQAGAYSAGAAVRSINPTPAMIAAGEIHLGGYGLAGGETVAGPPIVSPRLATGILDDGVGTPGASTRAVVYSDGVQAITLAQIETQGMFIAYKEGEYGLTDIRRHAAERIAALRADVGGPAMPAGAILVDSNHTHAGPDTAGVWGGVSPAYMQLVHDRTVEAIVEAWRSMRPVTLRFGTAKGGVEGYAGQPQPALITNQFREDPNNQAVDDELRVIQATDLASGEPVVTYLNFSAHATVLGSGNTLVSGDYTGPLSDLLGSAGGVGFAQVATLGRTQPARADCTTPGLAGAAADLCKLRSYSAKVYARVQQALDAATPITGTPVVAMHSYFFTDASTNAPILALSYGGFTAGAPINRAVTAPWTTGNLIGTVSFTGRIGDLLLSGGPGEVYPQIVAKVRSLVTGKRGYLSLGTAGDFLGYIIAPVEAYPEPVRRTFLDGGTPPPSNSDCSGAPSPVGCPAAVANDNYAFNVSHTMGERLTCSMLRGAGEVFAGDPTRYFAEYERCALFAADLAVPADFDTQFSSLPAAPEAVVPEGRPALLPLAALGLGAAIWLRRRRTPAVAATA